MQSPELLGALVVAVILGGVAFAVLAKTLHHSYRPAVLRWCYSAGGVSLSIVLLSFVLQYSPLSKTSIGIAFVGLPALVCGLLLSLHRLIIKAKSEKN